MLQELDFTQVDGRYRERLPRARAALAEATAVVQPLCEDVAQRGKAALQEYSQQYDHVTPPSFRVPESVLQESLKELDTEIREAFREAIRRRRTVAETIELPSTDQDVEIADGARVGLRSIPMQRVGLYVPGGVAPLASSVLMNVVPAQVAGVPQIAIASPPQPEYGGWPHPNICALSAMLGVTEVYAVGGAQAVAMFAHGVDEVCAKVDFVTGPGNIYVVAAKRAMRGLVGIDSEAGPTEIAILADDTANARFVAADLISQAEHDVLAASVLITDSARLAAEVQTELGAQLAGQKHSARIEAALTGNQSAVVLVRDIEQGIDVANAYAAEHLEIQTRDAAADAARIHNAGAIFVGAYAPVSLGDYSAGSTHVLPTAACSCHSSGLLVSSFLKQVHIVDYSRDALLEIAGSVEAFAHAEDLPGHAAAISVRRT